VAINKTTDDNERGHKGTTHQRQHIRSRETIAVSSIGAAESRGFGFGGDDAGDGAGLCVACRDFVSSLIEETVTDDGDDDDDGDGEQQWIVEPLSGVQVDWSAGYCVGMKLMDRVSFGEFYTCV
jgi:hypothetical protein